MLGISNIVEGRGWGLEILYSQQYWKTLIYDIMCQKEWKKEKTRIFCRTKSFVSITHQLQISTEKTLLINYFFNYFITCSTPLWN